MPCWVDPTVAAQLWGLSLEQVMGRVHAGTVASKVEDGYLLVDTTPAAAERPTSPPRRRRVRGRVAKVAVAPATVSDAELAALQVSTVVPSAEPCGIAGRLAAAADDLLPHRLSCQDEDEMGPAGDPDPDRDGPPVDEGPPLHWQTVRARVGRTRRPPGAR